MIEIYLWINAALYALFAALCTVKLKGTSSSLGYLTLSNSGRSEYLTVYGGLQLGLASFFALSASLSDMHKAGLLMALALYVPIVAFRLTSVVANWPVSRLTLGVAGLEATLLLWGAWLGLVAGMFSPG